jgi:hypothetical protein
MTLLTVIVAVGFLGCWFLLWGIAETISHCAAKLTELNSTADDIVIAANQISISVDENT